MWETLYRLQSRQTGESNRFKMEVVNEDQTRAEEALRALSEAFVQRYEELTETDKPTFRIVGEPEISRSHEWPMSLYYLAALCRPFG